MLWFCCSSKLGRLPRMFLRKEDDDTPEVGDFGSTLKEYLTRYCSLLKDLHRAERIKNHCYGWLTFHIQFDIIWLHVLLFRRNLTLVCAFVTWFYVLDDEAPLICSLVVIDAHSCITNKCEKSYCHGMCLRGFSPCDLNVCETIMRVNMRTWGGCTAKVIILDGSLWCGSERLVQTGTCWRDTVPRYLNVWWQSTMDR